MPSHHYLRSRLPRADPVVMAPNTRTRSSRLSDIAHPLGPVPVSRSLPDLSEDARGSFRLTLKMPSNRLREAGGRGKSDSAAGRRNVNIFSDNPIVSGPRNSRSKRKIVEVDTSEDEDDEVEDPEEDDVDEDDMDADGDEDVDDAPPRQPVPRRNAKANANTGKPVKSVEAKDMEAAEEDEEELSGLGSDAAGDDDEQEESGIPNGNEEGLEEEDEEEEEDEDDLDSDQGTPASRTSTPDFNKMTKRQRGNLGNDFLQLPMGKMSLFLL